MSLWPTRSDRPVGHQGIDVRLESRAASRNWNHWKEKQRLVPISYRPLFSMPNRITNSCPAWRRDHGSCLQAVDSSQIPFSFLSTLAWYGPWVPRFFETRPSMICYDMTSLKKALLLMDQELCYLQDTSLVVSKSEGSKFLSLGQHLLHEPLIFFPFLSWSGSWSYLWLENYYRS